MTPDLLNGLFECGGAWFTWRNAYQLYRDQKIMGAYWPAWFWFSAWGLWNLYYYPTLDQPWSFLGALVLVGGNLLYCVLTLRYK